MPQSRTTGAAGNRFGRETAPRVAAAIGAVMLEPGVSNAARHAGRTVVFKCARARTGSVGVTHRMLGAAEAVVAAFEQLDGTYIVYEVDAPTYGRLMQPTRSTGRAQGRVGVVTRRALIAHGRFLARVRLPADEGRGRPVTPAVTRDVPPAGGWPGPALIVEAPPLRAGYYRVSWTVDLPKDEFSTPREAAEHACELAGDCSGPVNVFDVLDGDTGNLTAHDLAS